MPVIGFRFKRVSRLFWKIRRGIGPGVMWRASARKIVIPCLQEKPLNVETDRPYCKPTQVGRKRILRCLSETRLRNSAN